MQRLSKAALVVAAATAVSAAVPAGASAAKLLATVSTHGVVQPDMKRMALTLDCAVGGVVQHAIIDSCYTSNGLNALDVSGVGPGGVAATAGFVPFGPYTACVSARGIDLDGKWVSTGLKCQSDIGGVVSFAVATG